VENNVKYQPAPASGWGFQNHQMGDGLIRLSSAEFPISTAIFKFSTAVSTDLGLNLWDAVAPATRWLPPSEAISEEEQLSALTSYSGSQINEVCRNPVLSSFPGQNSYLTFLRKAITH
jgi:hypothetical protein